MHFMYNYNKLIENIKMSFVPPPLIRGPRGKKRASTNPKSPFYTNKWAVKKLTKRKSQRQ